MWIVSPVTCSQCPQKNPTFVSWVGKKAEFSPKNGAKLSKIAIFWEKLEKSLIKKDFDISNLASVLWGGPQKMEKIGRKKSELFF